MKLNKREAKLIETINRLGIVQSPRQTDFRVNPFSGKSVWLTAQLCQLYDFITTKNLVCGVDYTRRDWDLARMTFLKINPDAYYDLID